MADYPNTKSVNTTIPYDLWRQAQLNDVCWSDALEIGIQYIIGGVISSEKKIEAKINELKNEISMLTIQLEKVRKDKAAQVAAERANVVMEFELPALKPRSKN